MVEYVSNTNIDIILNCLENDAQRKVIIAFLGFDGQSRRKIETIAEELGMSRKKTYEIFKKAMIILRSEKVVNALRNQA